MEVDRVQVVARRATKKKLDDFAARWRLPLVEVVDVAISAVELLTTEQIMQLIHRQPPPTPRPKQQRQVA
jgi:hypothetical protein